MIFVIKLAQNKEVLAAAYDVLSDWHMLLSALPVSSGAHITQIQHVQ